MKRIAILVALLLPAAFAVQSPSDGDPSLKKIVQPMLWKVSGNGLEKPSWLFGTIHIGDPRITGGNLNPGVSTSRQVSQAFKHSDDVFVELDASDSKTANEVMKLSMLPKGKTIEDVVDGETVLLIKQALKKISSQVPLLALNQNSSQVLYNQFYRMKPMLLPATMSALPVMMMYMGSKPLDTLICEKAHWTGKTLHALETPQQQIDSFEVLNAKQQEEFLAGTCREIIDGDVVKDSQELCDAYVLGDAAAVQAALDDDNKKAEKYISTEIIEKLNKSILTERNTMMAEKIREFLSANPGRSCFVAVGAAHMLGDDGLVKQLQKAGYTVRRVQAKSASKSKSKPRSNTEVTVEKVE